MIQTRTFALAVIAIAALTATAACDRFPDAIRVPVTGGNQTPVLVTLTQESVNRIGSVSRSGSATSTSAQTAPAAASRQVVPQQASASPAMAEVFPGYFCPANVIDRRSKARIWGERKEGTYPY